LELMSVSSKRGIGKIITARNYVGLVIMKDGTAIEILPKIYSKGEVDSCVTKKVFLEMLKTVKEVPYKTFNVSSLKAEHINLFEIFIRMFIEEVYAIVKGGLKTSYLSYSGNESFFKGKLLVLKHIKHNMCHKERIYVEYDVLSPNRPENKLIKSTLQLLQKHTTNSKNKKDLSNLMASFVGIDVSRNPHHDFSLYVKNRNMSGYDTALKWCKVFLLNKSFTAFAGSELAYALLFPMEYVFECYVAAKLKKVLDKEKYSISIQDKSNYLFDYPSKKFALKPDIVLKDNTSGKKIVLDTKWKLLAPCYPNFGISQADMYQMYAYGKKYAAHKVILLYPWNENVRGLSGEVSFSSNDGVFVNVMFVDLMNIDKSIEHIFSA
jgi:5-methylcytosine-specific restriction enzyme subunit McrC